MPPRKQPVGQRLDHSPAGKANPNLSGLLATGCLWHKVVAQLLNITQVVSDLGKHSMEKADQCNNSGL